MIPILFLACFILGFALWVLTSLAWLTRVPGMHFDEAWAGNHAYRILTEPGFWPADAMSPYTRPWAHYITSFFFRELGTSLFAYRLAGFAMLATGVLFGSWALWRAGERKAMAIFPWLLASCVPFVLNGRFCIEITSFQVLCLGVLAFGLSGGLHRGDTLRRHPQIFSLILIFAALFFGVTAHILFLAPALALLAVWAMQSVQWRFSERVLVTIVALGLWPFLWRIHQEIPEKDKAAVLLAVDALVLLGVFFFGRTPRFLRRNREILRWIVGLAALPFFLEMLLFFEGHWSVLFTYGRIAHPAVLWISVPVAVGAAAYGTARYWSETWHPFQRRFWSWFLFTVLLTGILAVKPAPRYYQMVFFMLAMGGALILARLPVRRMAGLTALLVFSGGLVLSCGYFSVGLGSQGVDRSYRFLIFHDSSEDSLSKQDLVRHLGELGCEYTRVETSDARLAEVLRFLSHGDWPVSATAHCPGTSVRVERAANMPGGAGSERFGEFTLAFSP